MPTPAERQPAAARAAAALRERILAGDIAPGTPLREEELAAAAGVSRHTMRAALQLLAAERIAIFAPYRGVRVADLGGDDLLALQDLRCALESEAVELLRERHGTAWPAALVEPVEAAIDELHRVAHTDGAAWPDVARAHAAVHAALVGAAASPRLAEAHARLESEVLLLLLHVRPGYTPDSLVAEHRAYLASVRREGRAAVRRHLDGSTAMILGAAAPSSLDA